jgi:uncharacterized membrane protein
MSPLRDIAEHRRFIRPRNGRSLEQEPVPAFSTNKTGVQRSLPQPEGKSILGIGIATESHPNRAKSTLFRALGGIVLAVLAFASLRFLVRDPLHYIVRPTPESFGPHYWPHRLPLVLHIIGGVTALVTGPFQLWTGLRRRSLHLHRLTGYAYIFGVALAGAAAFALARFAEPRDFGIALAALAAAWWTCIGMAFVAIRRHRIDQHRQWMIRGYVVTFSFTSFRYLIDLPIWQGVGAAAPSTAVWLSWVIPLLFTEVLLQWRKAVTAYTPSSSDRID